MEMTPAIHSALEQKYRDVLVQTLHDNLVYRGELSCIAGALAVQGIECVLFKGLSLDHSLLRPTGDIDLLVERPRLLDAIDCILRVPGYQYVEAFGNGTRWRYHDALSDSLRRRIAAQAAWKHEFLAYNSRRGVLVELHVSLFPRAKPGAGVADPPSSEAILQHIWIERCFRKGLGCYTPSPEHSLLIMCLHNSLKRSPANNRLRVGTLVDIAAFAKEGLRWDWFVRDCVELRIAPYAYFSLRLARRLLDARVPGHVLASLSGVCSPLDRFLARLHLRCAKSLESSDWLYATLYSALRPWSIPGAWAQRVAWVLGLPLLLPTHDRMAAMLAENSGSFPALISWLFNPIRWTAEALGRYLERTRTRPDSARMPFQANNNKFRTVEHANRK